jgi:hypothetical protein
MPKPKMNNVQDKFSMWGNHGDGAWSGQARRGATSIERTVAVINGLHCVSIIRSKPGGNKK